MPLRTCRAARAAKMIGCLTTARLLSLDEIWSGLFGSRPMDPTESSPNLVQILDRGQPGKKW